MTKFLIKPKNPGCLKCKFFFDSTYKRDFIYIPGEQHCTHSERIIGYDSCTGKPLSMPCRKVNEDCQCELFEQAEEK